jgi:hypothetical protein
MPVRQQTFNIHLRRRRNSPPTDNRVIRARNKVMAAINLIEEHKAISLRVAAMALQVPVLMALQVPVLMALRHKVDILHLVATDSRCKVALFMPQPD